MQGINDIAATFLYCILLDLMRGNEVEIGEVEALSDEKLFEIESDTFWCLERFTESIQDNYTDGFEGILKI